MEKVEDLEVRVFEELETLESRIPNVYNIQIRIDDAINKAVTNKSLTTTTTRSQNVDNKIDGVGNLWSAEKVFTNNGCWRLRARHAEERCRELRNNIYCERL